MGELIGGVWHRTSIDSTMVGGEIKRQPAVFNDWVTADGSAPVDRRGFKAEPGRYHLYVSLACPWAHRTIIMRQLKGLEAIVGMSVVHWLMGEDGWVFEPGPGVIMDDVNGVAALHELYSLSDPDCTSRVTVPVLWDKETRTIVSNESSEIIRMFNSAFDHLGARGGDYYPSADRATIDALNERIYTTLNNGVYRAGFATFQATYNTAFAEVFATLDWLEETLSDRLFLLGDQMTEADIRLFTTLVRFDAVYHGHFKCNLRRISDYPRLWAYTLHLYNRPEIRSTVNFDHIKNHYYASQRWLNPTGIVALGPHLDFSIHSDTNSERTNVRVTADPQNAG